MLNDFAQKKETFFGYKKQKFSKSKKSAFPMGLAHAFGQKMPFSALLRFGQNKSKKKLNYFKEKKKPFLTVTKRIFQSPKNRIFFKGVNRYFWPKNALFSLFRFDKNETRNNTF